MYDYAAGSFIREFIEILVFFHLIVAFFNRTDEYGVMFRRTPVFIPQIEAERLRLVTRSKIIYALYIDLRHGTIYRALAYIN